MPRKDRYPKGRHGADGDHRFELIERDVASQLNAARKRQEYEFAYDQAKQLKESGKDENEIRQKLSKPIQQQEYSAEDTPRMSDHKKANDRVNKALAKLRQCGLEDAIGGRPPKVPDTAST